MQLGRNENALEWLERSYIARHIVGDATGAIKADAVFDPLLLDPRFADILRRMNLTP